MNVLIVADARARVPVHELSETNHRKEEDDISCCNENNNNDNSGKGLYEIEILKL